MDPISAGFISGSIQTVVGHPFDTWKVRLLASNNTCLVKKANQKYKGMYKGFLPALFSGCLSNAFLFGIEDYMNSNYTNYMQNHWKSGFTAGFFSSFIIHPLEYLKCKYQINQEIIIREIYKGIPFTIMRETIGSATYFYVFHYYYNDNNNNNNNNNNYLYFDNEHLYKSLYKEFHAGGIAGVSSWFISFPFDVIKTRIQCNVKTTTTYNVKNIGFGLVLTLIRAYLVNASLFFTYKNLTGKNKE